MSAGRRHLLIAAGVLSVAPVSYLIFRLMLEHGECGYCGYLMFSWVVLAALIIGAVWALAAVLMLLSERAGSESEVER